MASPPVCRKADESKQNSKGKKLTCPVGDTGSEWMTVTKAHQCYQAPVSRAACSASLLLQSLLPDTHDEPTPLTLGRKAYVSLVLENHQNI